MRKAETTLTGKTKKAIERQFNNYLPPAHILTLHDRMIAPAFDYQKEAFGFINYSLVEKVCIQFCKKNLLC